MDCLGLAGEKPTMPAPPNAGPAMGLAPAIWLPPEPALGSVGLPEFAALGSVGLALGSEPPPLGLIAPDPMGVQTLPWPVPASTPPMPIPLRGWPKKPMARGALFCP